jgi:hypothetical protein
MYARLTSDRRAQMLALLAREENAAELELLNETVPRADVPFFERAVGVLWNVHSYLAALIEGLAAAAEGNLFELRYLLQIREESQWQARQLAVTWRLTEFPVTQAEYTALVEREEGALWLLADFARHVAGLGGSPDAWQLCAPVRAMLAAMPQELALGERSHVARSVVNTAIGLRQLPQPHRTKHGPALPRKILRAWLLSTDVDQLAPPGAEFYVPVVGLLGGHDVPWRIHPDEEASHVRQARERIVRELALLVGIEASHVDPHPPVRPVHRGDPANVGTAYTPAVQLPDSWGHAVARLGARHGAVRVGLRVYTEALDRLAQEDFGGEDPAPPWARAQLAAAGVYADDFERSWAAARSRAHDEPDGELPALHAPTKATIESRGAALLGRLRGHTQSVNALAAFGRAGAALAS